MRLRAPILLFVLALLSLTAFAACGDGGDDAAGTGDDANRGGSGETPDWPAFFDLPSLIEASDAIVVAQLGRERTETIDAPASEGSDTRTTVTEILRTFVVEEPIKGDLQRNDLINVFNTANVAVERDDGSVQETAYQVLRIEEDQSYLLFLTLVEVPDYYPEDLGDYGWAAPGEPHTARVSEAGQLQWETTGRYDEALEERGIPPGDSGAGEAFDATVQLVAALASGGGATPIPDDAGESATP